MTGFLKLEPETAADKKSQIIAAAARVFAEKGFFQAKVEEIAVAAGVGKGTVYEYFSSKTDLFQEMMYAYTEQYLHCLRQSFDSSLPVIRQLQVILKSHLQFLLENTAGMSKLGMEAHPPINEEMRAWFFAKKMELVQGLANILQKGIEQGEVKATVNTLLAAQLIFGVMMSLSSEIVLGKQQLEVDRLSSEVLALVFGGLAA